MKSNRLIASILVVLTTGIVTATAQFNSGSTGTVALLVTSGSTVTNDLPPDGKLHYTTITVRSNGTLRFRKNALNTPVYLLATGNVLIEGTVDVSGRSAGTNQYVGGEPGPGGFAGGAPGYLLQPGLPLTLGGNGLGPGGGRADRPAGYQNSGVYAYSLVAGDSGYGYPHLIPLVGGSGGAGASNSIVSGGGGGGGAILIASSTRIQINASGRIVANGGDHDSTGRAGTGSGGAIRLVAPMVLGNGTLDVKAVVAEGNGGSRGRIRIDSVLGFDPSSPSNPTNQLAIADTSSHDPRVWMVGKTMIVFPTNQPRLDIVQVGPIAIPEGTNNPVSIQLPPNASTNQIVRVRASDFAGLATVSIVVTPENGISQPPYNIEIDNSAAGSSEGEATISLPLNMRVSIQAWKR